MAIHVIYSVKTTTSCLPIIVVLGVKEWRGLRVVEWGQIIVKKNQWGKKNG